MKQIRHSVFETNSSSSHSISIRKVDEMTTPEELAKEFDWRVHDNGSLCFWDHDLEFGRAPFEPLVTFYDKLRFAIASLADDKKLRKEIENIMFKYIPGLKKIEYPTQCDWKTDKEETYYGYIDHQSLGLLGAFLASNHVTIEEFLLNKKYVVFIDGDEYCIKEKLFITGLLHTEDFVDEEQFYEELISNKEEDE